MKIPKFTFEDWEKDTIPKPEFKVPTEMDLSILLEEANMLRSLTDEDFLKIQECQIKTYDMAVEMFFEAKKQRYLINCKRIADIKSLEMFKNQEYKWVEKDVEKDEDFIQMVTVGYKHTNSIAGGTFKKVEAKYLQWKGGKYNSMEVNDLKESLTFPLSAYLKYSYWLKDQNESEQRAKNRVKNVPTFKELFSDGYKTDENIAELKQILFKCDFTILIESDKYQWKGRGMKPTRNQLSTICHYLRENGVFKVPMDPTGLMVFYAEFGLKITPGDKKEPGDYANVASLDIDHEDGEMKILAKQIFKEYVRREEKK